LLVLWLGSHEVIRGRITLGQFVAFNAYLTMLSWPMIAFGWVTNTLQRGMASWKRMLEVLDTEPAIADAVRLPVPGPAEGKEDATGTVAIRGDIEFRDLVFSYGDARVLDHVSATIEAGQTVALVGVTGSGKSTLISLLARLHDPPPGSVFIDGTDVRELPLDVLRRAIGFVPQEPFLFSDTLADNVAFGLDATDDARLEPSSCNEDAASLGRSPWAPAGRDEGEPERRATASPRGTPGKAAERHERIHAAAAVARLDKDVADFPQGFQTMVGERGITLSGGQKQRTALARAIAVDPRILILDDALSAVDTYTEEEILSRLRGIMRQRTTILVSHRISTVRDADQILVLDRGHIVERGTHDALIGQGGLYAELHEKQLLEEELAAS